MRRLAAEPNVMVKLSGLGTFIHHNDPDHIAWILRETLPLFGSERCLFGSNFPIEKLWTDYAALLAAYRDALAWLSPEARQAVLHGTAARIYRLSTTM
jgi:predicted TIM-barrel fold metal-dependent hydrolase